MLSELFSDIGNTSESVSENDIQKMKEIVKKTMNKQIKRVILFGVISFISNFLNVCFWSLVGQRCIHFMKRSYFTTILSQEQGWFDAHNAFEFATKVQAQLEQVEMGIGDKFGQILMMISQWFCNSFYYFLENYFSNALCCTFYYRSFNFYGKFNENWYYYGKKNL